MIQTGFESKVKVQDLIENQLQVLSWMRIQMLEF